jgi:nucleotide-binding universal stress UspA family protein
MKKILVPTDFSELSENALMMAVDVCRNTGSEVYLVNFMDHPFGNSFSSMGLTGRVEGSDADLFTLQLSRKNHARLADLAKKHGQSVKINYQVYGEEYSDGFKDYIKEQAIDLVVMGTSGEESAEEFFSGNHTQQMMEGATCPVISIRGNYKESNFNEIIVGIDFNHDKHDNFTQAAALLNDFASAVRGHLHLVHVAPLNSDKAKIEKEVHAFVEKYGFKNYTLVVTQNNDLVQGLITYSFAKKGTLLALLTHSEGGLFRVFTKSTAEEMTKKMTIPVMAINLHNI